MAGRFGDGGGCNRAVARGAGHEWHRKGSRGLSAGRGANAGADRGPASRAEEARIVARNGGDADVPRRRKPRAPGKKCGGAIGGAKLRAAAVDLYFTRIEKPNSNA